MDLTHRDIDIIKVLTTRIRVLSLNQIGEYWWASSARPDLLAGRRVEQLESCGLLFAYQAMCHPLLRLESPVILWMPGQQEPEFASAAYQLQVRWCRPPILTNCVIATEEAASRFGGYGGRRPRLTEQTHDLHLAAVYLKLRQADPSAAMFWKSEAELLTSPTRSPSDRLPDALIDHPAVPRVVEFGGAYRRDKLVDFHQWCANAGYAYEVW